jgi:cell division protein FtsZ
MDVLGDDVSMDDAFKAADNVLRNAVGGIAEIINFPGLVNVDFEDVRTVMGEMGMAMMGSASAPVSTARALPPNRAVASPLLEGRQPVGRQGRAGQYHRQRSLKMKEVNEVMNTVRAFAADDAHIIFGAVYDESIDEEIRVTVVATGLGQAQAKRQSFEVINTSATQATGTDGRFANGQSVDYSSLDQTPAVFRKGRSATVEALANSGVDRWDIPAFLRKQAD